MNENRAVTKVEATKLLKKLQETSAWKKAKSIATTISSPIEVPTEMIVEAALTEGKKVYLPKCMPKRQMAFLPFTNREDLIVSDFGLSEPAYNEDLVNQEPDLVIVPGLAFAKDTNYRVGFGGGYYDRFLSQYQGNTVALVPSAMEFESADWQVEDHDIQIDQLILAD